MKAIKLWHGAQKWDGCPTIQPIKSGSHEYGPGIYLTTAYFTAQKYAKGAGSVYRMNLSPNTKWMDEVEVSLDEMREWVKNEFGLRRKTRVLNEFDDYERLGKGKKIRASLLIHFCVDHSALTAINGQNLALWLTSKGIDAYRIPQGGEEWVVVFNPKCIINAHKTQAKDIRSDEYDHPKIADQIKTIQSSESHQHQVSSELNLANPNEKLGQL